MVLAINQPHYHTHDNGKHLHPCVKTNCNGYQPSRNSPTITSKRYQVNPLRDPLAKPSKVGFSNITGNTVVGDGDIWVEVLYRSNKTGTFKSFFKSTKNPDLKVANEPPTGASRVVFLNSNYRDKFIEFNETKDQY